MALYGVKGVQEMNLTLTRKKFGTDGIFGEIEAEAGEFFCVSLERAYMRLKKFKPKIPPGEYVCKRGTGPCEEEGMVGFHKLRDEGPWFDTFEVMDVPGCVGILFHVGNYNEDSEGCILIGTALGNRMNGGKMLTSSKQMFKKFMDLQKDVDSFILKVEAV